MPMPPDGGCSVVPRGTALPTGSLPVTGRAYAGTPDPPLPPLAALPVPSPVRRPRSPLGVALFTWPSLPLAVPPEEARGPADPALPPLLAGRPSRGIACPALPVAPPPRRPPPSSPRVKPPPAEPPPPFDPPPDGEPEAVAP